jgi:flagellar biosynthetic protein FlhB
MADTDQERTEDPTAKRLEEAREKGQIARSKELGTACVLISAAVALLFMGESLAKALVEVMRQGFTLERAEVFDMHLMFRSIKGMLMVLVEPMGWILLIILVAAFLGNTAMGGITFSWEAARPKASKLSPFQGIKRMIGPQAGIELIKSIAKVLVVGLVVWGVLDAQFQNILALSEQSLPGSAIHAVEMLQWMFLLLVMGLLLIAAIDVPFQKWNHNKQLKMTKQEIKDEHKNMEGNPEIKGRIRRLQMEMTQRRMMNDVPKADVVVTNPTHYSVALKYDPNGSGAPTVVAKGVDEIALKIREIAKHNGVLVLESPGLTRSLYHTTKIGKQIPDGLFVAVAQILAYVFQLEQYSKGRGRRPTLADDLPIPDDLIY